MLLVVNYQHFDKALIIGRVLRFLQNRKALIKNKTNLEKTRLPNRATGW